MRGARIGGLEPLEAGVTSRKSGPFPFTGLVLYNEQADIALDWTKCLRVISLSSDLFPTVWVADKGAGWLVLTGNPSASFEGSEELVFGALPTEASFTPSEGLQL